MPATETLMEKKKKKNLDSVCGARSRGAGWASEARVSSAGVALCWVFGFRLTLRCWVKSQSSGSENLFLSFSLFLFFRFCPCLCGLWSLIRQCEADLSSGCPPPPGSDVVGGSAFSPRRLLFFIPSGFSVSTAGRMHVFKPVSVQAMW